MRNGNGKTNRQKKGILIVAFVLALTSLSAALQTSVSNLPGAPTTSEFSNAAMRWVLVSIPDRKLALFENGKVIRVYRVAVGKTSTPSPSGEFKIVNRVTNPTYYHKGQVIVAGKSNPVGTRWMGLSVKGYGIHGTNQPDSIGKAASTGCFRMGKRDLEELFTLLQIGDTVRILAERDQQMAEVFGTGSQSDSDAEETAALTPIEAEKNSGDGQ
jgi:lipoprotein-anchoring transpeptidase ErfK/SrfK